MLRNLATQLFNKVNQAPGPIGAAAGFTRGTAKEDTEYKHPDRYIQGIENRHLYYIIGGVITFWVAAPILKSSYDSYSERKEKRELKNGLAVLGLDVENMKKELGVMRKELDRLQK